MQARLSRFSFRGTFISACLLCGLAFATAAAPPWPMLPRGVTPAEGEVWGELDNGFRYAIIPAELGEQRVSLRFVVAAGYAQQPRGRVGMLRLIERMATAQTRQFERKQLLALFLENGLGVPGDDFVDRSIDSTVYQFDLAHSPPGGLENAIRYVSDIAGGLSFEASVFERARDRLVEEARSNRDFFQASDAEINATFFRDSLYSNFGSEEIVSSLQATRPEELRAFWDAWYRPELMTLFVVGAVESAEVEGLLKQTFGGLSARAPVSSDGGNLPDRLRSSGDIGGVFLPGGWGEARLALALESGSLYSPSAERRYREFDLLARYAQSLAARDDALDEDALTVSGGRLQLVLSKSDSLQRLQNSLIALDETMYRISEYGLPNNALEDLQAGLGDLRRSEDVEWSGRETAPLLADRLVLSWRQGLPFRRGPAFESYFGELVGGLTSNRLEDLQRELFQPREACFSAVLPQGFRLPEKALSKALRTARKSYGPDWRRAGRVAAEWNLESRGTRDGMVESSERVSIGPYQGFRYVFQNNLRLNVVPTENRPGSVSMLLSLGNGLTDLPDASPALRSLVAFAVSRMTVAIDSPPPSMLDILEQKGLSTVSVRLDAGQLVWRARGEGNEDVYEFLLAISAWISAGRISERDFDAEVTRLEEWLERDGVGLWFRRIDALLFGDDARLRDAFEREDLDELNYSEFVNWLQQLRENGYIEVTVVGDLTPRTLLRDVRKSVAALAERSGKIIQPRHGKPATYPEPGFVRERSDARDGLDHVTVFWPQTVGSSCLSASQLRVIATLFEAYAQDAAQGRSGLARSLEARQVGKSMVPMSGAIRVDMSCPAGQGGEAERFLLELGASFADWLDPELVAAAQRSDWIELKEVARDDEALLGWFDQSQGRSRKLDCLLDVLGEEPSLDFAEFVESCAAQFAEGNARGVVLQAR